VALTWAESYLGRVRTSVGDADTILFVGARGVILDEQNRLLLIQRSDNLRWAIPAGAMELAEHGRSGSLQEAFALSVGAGNDGQQGGGFGDWHLLLSGGGGLPVRSRQVAAWPWSRNLVVAPVRGIGSIAIAAIVGRKRIDTIGFAFDRPLLLRHWRRQGREAAGSRKRGAQDRATVTVGETG